MSIYYFHPDHLGSSTVITDMLGNAYQIFLNLPFGETFAEQRRSSFKTPYKFNGKELDANTGLYYYGARYYDPRISNWLSVDPMAEKYPSWSPYNYTLQNPIRYIDPDGRDIVPWIVYDITVRKFPNGKWGDIYYHKKSGLTEDMQKVVIRMIGTEEGKAFLLQYMKAGQEFYGLRADKDGKLSDHNLNIYDIRNHDEIDNEYRWVMNGPEGQIANGKTSFNEFGDMDVKIGTADPQKDGNNLDYLFQTVAHEFGKHASHHQKYLNLFNAGNCIELKNEQDIDWNKDHYESKNPSGAKIYNNIMRQAGLKPEWPKEAK